MQITKTKDYVLLKTSQGEYHLTHAKYKSLGKQAAIKFAENEISKKSKSTYTKKTITFKDARELGFCEYGIKYFCNQLKLDITQEYSLKDLLKGLTVEFLLSYSDECLKLFGKNVFKPFDGPVNFLESNRTQDAMTLVFKSGLFSDTVLYTMACDFAYSCLPNFESVYPEDKRPRLAIEARLGWLEGTVSDKKLASAANSAYYSATYSPRSATYSAANSEYYSAYYSAAYSAYYSAANSATYLARSSVIQDQVEYVLFMLALNEIA
jgi:hypothetical protein